jgi:hypothetical protein
LLVVLVLLASGAWLRADTLLLKSGGRVQGQIQRRPAQDARDDTATYLVRVADGIVVRVAARDVGRVIEVSEAESEYQRLLPEMPDTAAGHEAMAKWCQERGLNGQKDFHWQHVLRHDPDHAEARRVLGYNRIGGRWIRAEDFMQAQGYIRYKGAWRLPQQVATEQQQEELDVAEKAWRRDIELWRNWLKGRRHGEGMQRLQAIDNPLAAAGLAQALADEEDVATRELFVDLLSRLATPLAIDALVDAAINDPDLEVRLRCVDRIRDSGANQAVGAWCAALQSRDNRMVGRAGVALGRLGNPAAVKPLIDALVTQHETIVKPSANIQPSFGSNPDGTGGFNGLSVGGGPKKIRRDVQNKSVLEALVALTGQNYRYSQSDWNNWYMQQRALPDGVNLRRDALPDAKPPAG